MSSPENRTIWVDYLRSTITLMVVAHHASLAYTTFARADPDQYIRSTAPVVDSTRWIGMDLFQNFNDVFFMALMFLIGGLFLSKSIQKKGQGIFIKDRVFRLLIPFFVLGTSFMLIAYFPSYYLTTRAADLAHYVQDFFTTQGWPSGPPWFVWILFLFNLVFGWVYMLYKLAGKWTSPALTLLSNRPGWFFLALFIVTWLLHTPLAYHAGPGTWVGMGPFDFQLSRIALYFGYFSVGILIGQAGVNRVFSSAAGLVKNWKLWAVMALTVYATLVIASGRLTYAVEHQMMEEFHAWMIYYTLFAASCTLSSIAFLTGFKRLIHSESTWMRSLSDNAYMIYLIHYIFVIWAQFILLPVDLPAWVKFLLTFTAGVLLSWGVSSSLRRIPVIKRYV
jgi:glucans biosynthesis protein C